mgnify:CR=1 FL=1
MCGMPMWSPRSWASTAGWQWALHTIWLGGAVWTAITADMVDASGMHLGGCIAPGVERLIGSLTAGTALQAGRAETVSGLQRTTEGCVDAGINLMLEGFVAQLKGIADQEMPKGYRVVVTGGDARRLSRHLPEATLVEELVFDGLALACPVRV